MRSTFCFAFIIICIFISIESSAQNFHMVKDINNEPDANPSNSYYTGTGQSLNSYAILNSVSYFSANDGLHGTELWRSDGTDTGTYMLKDINSGINGSNITSISVFKNELYFSANDGIHGIELWKSDGTLAGTTIVKDINPGSGDANPSFIISNGTNLFFAVSYGNSVNQFWKSDGSDTGTQLIKDFSDSAYYINSPTIVGNYICFFAIGANGYQLWRTDGTNSGTIKLKDLLYVYFLDGVASNGQILFFGDATAVLWRSDGTAEGTSQLAFTIAPMSGFTIFDNLLIFITNYNYGGDLWQSNGTPNGTGMFHFNQSQLSSTTVVNNTIFFLASLNANQHQLWKSDGTGSGTVLVKQFDSGYYPESNSLTAVNKTLYFSGYSNTHGYELWKSDGSPNKTTEVEDIFTGISSSNSSSFTLLKKNVLFSADDGQHGQELWITDTASNKTQLLRDINLSNTTGSNPLHLTAFKNKLFFAAKNNAVGNEIWNTDGTETGTALIKNIQAGSLGSIQDYYPGSVPFFQSGTNIYFAGTTQQYGSELWKTNGDSAETYMVDDLAPGAQSGQLYFTNPGVFNQITDVSGRLYFINKIKNQDGTSPGTGLYTTRGLQGDVSLILSANSSIEDLTPVNQKLFYFRNNPLSLWITDSTDQTNMQITTAQPDGRNSLFAYKNHLYFGSGDGYMWKTDGTDANTFLFKEIRPDPIYSSYSDLNYSYNEAYTSSNAVLNGILYFAAFDPVHGSELWKTDGTKNGTTLVKDINIGTADAQLGSFTIVNNVLYFLANDGIHGRELWKTDGTEEGTLIIKDITEGGASSEIFSLTKDGNEVAFLLYNAINNSFKLWQSDGSLTGTKEVEDIALNNIQIAPPLRVINNQIYFAATSVEYGSELWVGSLDGVLATQLFDFNGRLINNSDVQLNWTTTNDQNLSYFNLQRSVDGIHFFTITKVDSKGSANSQINYQYLDKNIAALATKNIYYRLEEIDKDGKPTLSNTVLIQLFSDGINISVLPNPIHSNFEIHINNVKASQQVYVQILNIRGNVIFLENKNLSVGNNVLVYNSSSWPGGIYLASIYFSDGTKKEIKITKQ